MPNWKRFRDACNACNPSACPRQDGQQPAVVQLRPEAASPVTTEQMAELTLRDSLQALYPRVMVAQGHVRPETVSDAGIAELTQIRDALRALVSSAQPDNLGLPDVLSTIGHVGSTLARGCALLGRHAEARAWFVDAAAWFDRSAEPGHAADCRARAEDLDLNLVGNLDRKIERQLEIVVASSDRAGGASGDHLEKVAALIALTESTQQAGDAFEAARNAEAAAGMLFDLGFLDPQAADLDPAVDSWIRAAAQRASGAPFLALFTRVYVAYLVILRARHTVNQAARSAVAERAGTLCVALGALWSTVAAEVAAADAELARDAAGGAPASAAAIDGGAADSWAMAIRAAMDTVDEHCVRLCEECDRRMAAGLAVDDLVTAADSLVAPAAAISRLYEAKVHRVRANLLCCAGKPQDQLAAAEACLVALLNGRPSTLSSLAQAYERTVYLDALTWKAKAELMQQRYDDLLSTCEQTMRDVESRRYLISSPYQQSAFLASVSWFYQWAALAAFKLGRWDPMLQAMELIKARSAVASRRYPGGPVPSTSALEAELDKVSAALSAALAAADASPHVAELKDRRRRIWDLLAIARGHQGLARELPQVTVDSLRAAIAEDEAVIGYFWLSVPHVLLVTTFDRHRFHPERVILDDDAATALADYVAALHGPDAERPIDIFERAATRLGGVLLPAVCRDIIRDKQRLIFSPHQQLHLFPFHATRWGDEFLGVHFAVRYVPNLSSLLLTWEGRCEDRLLAIGIDKFAAPSVPALETAEAEVTRAAELHAKRGTAVELLRGPAATWDALQRLRPLARFRCVHLATHGHSVFADGALDQPMESSLELYDRSIDGIDLAGLELAAELVVLTACNSGQRAIDGRGRDLVPGDDIFGLQWALFQSGVHSVLGSLWPLDDKTGGPLIETFHRHYAAGHPAEVALQAAVAEHVRNARKVEKKPYFWAALFLSSLGATAPAQPTKEI